MEPTHVAVITGTRAEYGLLRSSMEAIEARDDLRLSTLVTGMHLSPTHGNTIDEIRADGFEITDTVYMLLQGDDEVAMAKSLGIGVSGLAESLESIDPDAVLVLGDRDEALAGALASAHMNICVAHIHGGDAMSGAVIDDSIRHAITKFAHLHFPASRKSAERIERLGEEPWRITTAGAPGLDAALSGSYTAPDEVLESYDLSADEPLALIVQHPLTTSPEAAGEQMRATLAAAANCADLQAVVIYPNADAGGQAIIDVIESFTPRDWFATFRSLPRADYLGLLAAADVMIGNSSSGIIEAPSFDLPVVDVGPRQEGRERAENVLSVPHDRDAIHRAIRRCLDDDAFRERVAATENPYDEGGAGDVIASRLTDLPADERLLQKQQTY